MDKLIEMNHEMLMTPNEIFKETGIETKDMEILFNKYNVELLKLKEISRLKREKDFELLYDLHFIKNLSLNEIYRQFGLSPLYTKRVFEDKGIPHQGFINQCK
ncbi:AraC family transcriptional regulator [Bacillus sp. SCS-151]|uniref:AraC family transcriptional regulator n=1 Tax=Nanhaiella sioensis TaxID=3115293 RepID=UPI003978EAF6